MSARVWLRCGQVVWMEMDVQDVYDALATMRDEGVGLEEGFLWSRGAFIRAAAIEAVTQ